MLLDPLSTVQFNVTFTIHVKSGWQEVLVDEHYWNRLSPTVLQVSEQANYSF